MIARAASCNHMWNRSEERADLVLFRAVDVVDQRLSDRRFLGPVFAKLRGLCDQRVIELKIGRHAHHPHTYLYTFACITSNCRSKKHLLDGDQQMAGEDPSRPLGPIRLQRVALSVRAVSSCHLTACAWES